MAESIASDPGYARFDGAPPSPAAPERRRVGRLLATAAAWGTAVLIGAGSVGQVFRDRSVASALLMYLPLLALGAFAVVLDASRKGRSLPRPRFGLATLGLAAIAWTVPTMLGRGAGDRPDARDQVVSVLHGNVQWGGGLFRGPRTWEDQCTTIAGLAPDLIVLSEAPPDDWLARLTARLGPGASFVGHRHDPSSPYWYHLAVVSRRPIRLEEGLFPPGGAGVSASVEVRGRRIHLLGVDGVSTPTRSRLPFLRAVAAACRQAEASGRPYDLVLGDFNTPSRSVGFDAFVALGYRLAGRSSRGWRGTFPAWLPVYDIDHVWVRAGLGIASCMFFNGPHTGHRGQVAHILLPKEAPP